MSHFELMSDYQPTGDQPHAIEMLTEGLSADLRFQTLLGATGTGKTYTIANVIAQVQRPTLVLAHNKTLAAQLYAEFKEFFPNNAVEYFVSYYDYYQPEAYVPRRDLFIEKETQINEEIDRLRLSATASLLSRRDVLIVASVSCIYGLGNPAAWGKAVLELKAGVVHRRDLILRHLVGIQYSRNDLDLKPGTFRVRGDTVEIMPAYSQTAVRVAMFGDEIERLVEFDPLTGEVLQDRKEFSLYPAKQFITDADLTRQALHDIEQELETRLDEFNRSGRLLEAQRLEQRTRYDLEMIRELGYTSGIENYSRHLDQRAPGSPPWTLLDYFPSDFLMVVDESHMTLPQVRGMYGGDRSRKETLVEYGFRLPSAMDNRPLSFSEFEERIGQTVFMSATPGPYENEHAEKVVQQIIRPTGILDPTIDIRPVMGQIDDLLAEVTRRVERGERALVTTLTKRMSEDLADYLLEMGIRVHYLHSEIDTIERIEILRDLRLGVYDVVVGINLLREGIDLPEVSLIVILDADKQGFLRSEQALIQTIGRAARHVEGHVIMYADKMTDAMTAAISETERRRTIQAEYNEAHHIVPASIVKEIKDLTQRMQQAVQTDSRPKREAEEPVHPASLPKSELMKLIDSLEHEMKLAAKALEFEKAAALRDQLMELRQIMVFKDGGREVDPSLGLIGQTRRPRPHP